MSEVETAPSAIVCRMSKQAAPLQLVGFDGKLFKLHSDNAFAPGQPLVLEAKFNSSITLELKSIGSVKLADGRFEVRARHTTLRKEAREALFAHFRVR